MHSWKTQRLADVHKRRNPIFLQPEITAWHKSTHKERIEFLRAYRTILIDQAFHRVACVPHCCTTELCHHGRSNEATVWSRRHSIVPDPTPISSTIHLLENFHAEAEQYSVSLIVYHSSPSLKPPN